MSFSTALFDLDDTLYPAENGLWLAIRDRMARYMIERLELPADQVPALRRFYYETYGTTLRGLQIHHQVDTEDYLAYVHDLPLEDYLSPNPVLRNLLLSLPQKRLIFTNADSDHAKRVIDRLGLQDCFEAIFDIRAMHPLCKPELQAFERLLEFSGCLDPGQYIMLDDHLPNLAAAQRLGITTIWVNSNEVQPPFIDYRLSSILDLKDVAPQLWEI
jgi:putative hydrolase of the HAD superfamily